MSDTQTPSTPRRSTTRNAKPGGSPTTLSGGRKEDIFGDSPSKKGSASVKYGGKKKAGGGGGTGSSPSKAPDSRRGSLSTRLGLSNDAKVSKPASLSAPQRNNGTGKGSKKAAQPPSSTSASISTPVSLTPKKKQNLKRSRAAAEISITSDEEGVGQSDSELSELTTPPSSPPKPTYQHPPSSKASVISISSGSPSRPPHKPTGKRSPGKPKPVSKKHDSKQLPKSASWASSTSTRNTFEVPESWSLDTLGTHVMVMLNPGDPNGRVKVHQSEEQEAESNETRWYWWPAKVERSRSSTKDEFVVTPYGLNRHEELHLPVASASSSNILPLTTKLGHVRFETLTQSFPPSHPASNSAASSSVQRSPKKKRKLNKPPTSAELEGLYGQALAQALEEHQEDEYGGVPPLSMALSRAASFSVVNGSSPGRAGKGKQKRRPTVLKESISDDELTEVESANGSDNDSEEIEDPGPDAFVSVPDERILCRAKKSTMTEYWPAVVLEYVPPPKKGKGKGKSRSPVEGLYKVMYLDGITKEIPRSWFYVFEEDGFGTCKIGKFESEFIDNPNDDSDDEDSFSEFDFEAVLNSVSQQPPDSTSGETDFHSLPLPTQFVHVIPVLQAVLQNTYPPTRKRHEAFVKGGKSRSALKAEHEAGLRGRMAPKDAASFGRMVQGWCLGSSRKELQDTNESESLRDGDREAGPNGIVHSVDQSNGEVLGSTDDTSMAVDSEEPVGPTATTSTTVVTEDANAQMDGPDEVSCKENISPHPHLSVDMDTKPQSEATMVDAEITLLEEAGAASTESSTSTSHSLAPSPPQSSHPPSLSGASPALDLDDDRPGMAPPLPLLTTQGIATPPTMDEDSPLTPIASQETQGAAPPEAFEGNSERPRRQRERQIGCESYEALIGVEKVSYIMTLLHPIVIRQILLWRDGSRTPGQLQLLSDAEELALHEKAEELVKETDWVFDVVRLRAVAEKRAKKAQGEGGRARRAGKRG
ncbi:hypothetical protein V5O48_004891 [Marasmius crinis-equi]|uniref:PWWP domain-containing protein n=1 Tax=Marasmius crinis-equi TaxID=585013 RepID=A0ABR3FPT3_9AGAR